MIQQSNLYNKQHRNNIRETVSKATGVPLQAQHARPTFPRTAIIVAAFLMCLLIATSALAAGVPEVNALLYYVLPEAAQFFKPVQKSSVDQGIEVKVESAYIHGAAAEAVVSVRDLTGNRLDKSIDFDDSYDFRTGFDSFGTCSQIGYDEKTKTATFLIQTGSMDERNVIAGEKITMTFRTLLTGKTEALGLPIPLDWSAIPETVETETADPYEGTVLAPGDDQMEPESGFYFTGAGYVEDELHIQLFTPWRSVYDDHAFLYLLDTKGNRVDAQMRYRGSGYSDNAESEGREDYIDYIFPVPQSELAQYKLYGEFYSYKTRIDGNWSITFPITNDAK